jgi:hypothetical protein
MEAASAMVTTTSYASPARPSIPPPPHAPSTYSPSKSSSKNNNKKCKANDNKKIPSPAIGNTNNASTPPWSVPYNPWTSVV